jgi:hypothetical protein
LLFIRKWALQAILLRPNYDSFLSGYLGDRQHLLWKSRLESRAGGNIPSSRPSSLPGRRIKLKNLLVLTDRLNKKVRKPLQGPQPKRSSNS